MCYLRVQSTECKRSKESGRWGGTSDTLNTLTPQLHYSGSKGRREQARRGEGAGLDRQQHWQLHRWINRSGFGGAEQLKAAQSPGVENTWSPWRGHGLKGHNQSQGRRCPFSSLW